jgi:chromosome segregation ATPase
MATINRKNRRQRDLIHRGREAAGTELLLATAVKQIDAQVIEIDRLTHEYHQALVRAENAERERDELAATVARYERSLEERGDLIDRLDEQRRLSEECLAAAERNLATLACQDRDSAKLRRRLSDTAAKVGALQTEVCRLKRVIVDRGRA